MDLFKSITNSLKRDSDKSPVQAWLRKIEEAQKLEKEFRKRGKEIVEIYSAAKEQQNKFNILYSNTETLVPAMYNNQPRPVVKKRFRQQSAVATEVARIAQRTLEYLTDSGEQGYTTFDQLMRQSVLQATLPGRGSVKFKYDADLKRLPQLDPTAPSEEILNKEYVCGESVAWNKMVHGYATNWAAVPWVAIEHFMSKDEVKAEFGEKIANALKYTAKANADAPDSDERLTEGNDMGGKQLAHVWEIWDKSSRKVLFISPGAPKEVLREADDPLELAGFYPMPEPLMLFQPVDSLLPVALYTMYEDQAKELNLITARITMLIKALKLRGFFDSTVSGIDRLLESDDNTLMPAENVAAMMQGQTLERAIWFFPIEKLVGVLQQLYLQRESIKQVIFEINGIADIMRGSSKASETLGAQEIKNQWGTLRLKRGQKAVMDYVRSSLRIMAEIALTKLSNETLTAMTGLTYPTTLEKQNAQSQLQAIQMQWQAQAQQAQAMGQQPPPAPPPPVELLKIANKPSWEELRKVMSNDLMRNFQIDIETNSTIDAEATEDKQNVSEFLNAVAQFMNGIAPMVEKQIMPFDAAKEILLAATRSYRFGDEVEEQLRMMQEPKPKEDPAAGMELKKQEAELQKTQMEVQMQRAEGIRDINQMKLEGTLAQEKHAFELQKLAQEKELAQMEYQIKLAELEQAKVKLGIESVKAEAAMATAAGEEPTDLRGNESEDDKED